MISLRIPTGFAEGLRDDFFQKGMADERKSICLQLKQDVKVGSIERPAVAAAVITRRDHRVGDLAGRILWRNQMKRNTTVAAVVLMSSVALLAATPTLATYQKTLVYGLNPGDGIYGRDNREP